MQPHLEEKKDTFKEIEEVQFRILLADMLKRIGS